MTKVYQTIVESGKGNCMQAAIASLLDLNLEQVPNFVEFDGVEAGGASYKFMQFLNDNGYDYCCISKGANRNADDLIKIAKFDGGIGGYFYASVPSQTFNDVSHAVIVDSNLNIVHDPNPNQLALKLKPENVDMIITTTQYVIGKTGKIFGYDEWDKLSDEERELNTY